MTNSEKITLYFSQLEQQFNRLPEIIGEEVVLYSHEAFDKQGWDGVPWKPHKNKKDTGPILKKRGDLYNSIAVVSYSPSSVIVGSYIPYARIHNYGGVINKPAREEKFVRTRYKKGIKGKYFGGMGAFKKMTPQDHRARIAAGPIKGLSFKAYTINMPRRTFLAIDEPLRQRIRQRLIIELKTK